MIWLIGYKGMLGSKMYQLLKQNNLPFYYSDREIDITNSSQLTAFAKNKNIQWIVNCSAFTAVDRAEDEKEEAFLINATGVFNIAKIAREIDATVIHISTDYVFDGTKGSPYIEEDPANPSTVYGKSKYQGEELLKCITDKHFIIRTSWLFGENGKNFVATMLEYMNKKEVLKVVNDQTGCPTSTVDLALFINKIILSESKDYGTYHFSNDIPTTWYRFAQQIYYYGIQMRLFHNSCQILPITTEEYPTKAIRPKYSALSLEKTKSVFELNIRPWKEPLQEYLAYTGIKLKSPAFT